MKRYGLATATGEEPDNNTDLGFQAGGKTIYPYTETLMNIFDVAMRRPRKNWAEIDIPGAEVGEQDYNFLHFGGENKVLAGYTEVNYPEWDAEEMVPFPREDGTVNSIICLHTLDHLSSAAVQFWLKDCARMLVPAGVITIVVPHFMSTLAHECIEHKTQYGLKTWRNILGGGNDRSVDFRAGTNEGENWRGSLEVGFNMVMGLEERNLVLVTQLVKRV